MEKPLQAINIAQQPTDDEDFDIEVVLDDEEGAPVEEAPVSPQSKFDENLLPLMDSDIKEGLASDLITLFDDDKSSRKEWERTLSEGIKFLGLTMDEVSEPWDGAAGVIHPLMAEAVVRFQASTITEIFPAQGPVRMKIPGKQTDDRLKRGTRLTEYMNYQLTEVMEEYRPETERLLWGLGLSGCSLRKLYYDPTTGRVSSSYVESKDFIVPYNTKSLQTAERYTHVMELSENEVKRLQYAGLYDPTVDIGEPGSMSSVDDIEREEQKITGVSPPGDYEAYTILEMYCLLNIEGFEEGGGIAVPYIVTICKETGQLLSVYRNWKEGDQYYQPVSYFVDYHYIPGPGWYGLGFAHLIGGIAASGTAILRQLLDAGTLANVPGGFKARQLRVIGGDDMVIAPGEWKDVETYGSNIRDNILPLPYKEPSATLHALMKDLLDEGREFASLAELKVSDIGSGTPVGTVMAIIERQLKVMNSVHARIFISMKREFKILKRLFGQYGPYEYPYEVDEDRKILAQDFEDNGVDIIPVADPNAGTMAQRVVRLQAAMDLAERHPEIYDIPKLHRQMQEALGAKDIDEIIPNKDDIEMMDPVTENMAILTGKPTKVFEYQDHDAHMTVHMAMAQDPSMQELVSQSPTADKIGSAMMAHIADHLAFSYRDALEKELGAQLPPIGEPLPPEIERRLSKLVADAASRLFNKSILETEMKELAERLEDPAVRQKDRELDIKAEQIANKAKLDALEIERMLINDETAAAQRWREIMAKEDEAHRQQVVDLVRASLDYKARMKGLDDENARALGDFGLRIDEAVDRHVREREKNDIARRKIDFGGGRKD